MHQSQTKGKVLTWLPKEHVNEARGSKPGRKWPSWELATPVLPEETVLPLLPPHWAPQVSGHFCR